MGTVGVCLAAFGAFFAVFWMDFFDSQLAQVSYIESISLIFQIIKIPYKNYFFVKIVSYNRIFRLETIKQRNLIKIVRADVEKNSTFKYVF